MIRAILRMFYPPKTTRQQLEAELIEAEAAIGGQLFGPVGANTERKFFYSGNETWQWRENRNGRETTVSYQILPDRIIKNQDGQDTRLLDLEEISRLVGATRWYYHLVATRVYGRSS